MSDDESVVADASAVLALVKGEPFRGFDPGRISGATVSTVNLSEIISTLIGDGLSEELVYAAISPLELRIVSFDESQARAAARLRTATKHLGLSLGDRACLALAIALKMPAATADRAWSKLRIGAEILLIR